MALVHFGLAWIFSERAGASDGQSCSFTNSQRSQSNSPFQSLLSAVSLNLQETLNKMAFAWKTAGITYDQSIPRASSRKPTRD